MISTQPAASGACSAATTAANSGPSSLIWTARSCTRRTATFSPWTAQQLAAAAAGFSPYSHGRYQGKGKLGRSIQWDFVGIAATGGGAPNSVPGRGHLKDHPQRFASSAAGGAGPSSGAAASSEGEEHSYVLHVADDWPLSHRPAAVVLVATHTGQERWAAATPSRVQQVPTCAVGRQCHQGRPGEQLRPAGRPRLP
jgi:hypothetical protein